MDLFSNAYRRQARALLASSKRLISMREAVGRTGDLSLVQWGALFAIAMDYAPSLIIELGRGFGNSTCAFAEAAFQLESCELLSYCRSPKWYSHSVPCIRKFLPAGWMNNLDIRRQDILTVDFPEVVDNKDKILVFWDAHGYEIAATVLEKLLPEIAGKQHLVLMHDIADGRYVALQSYNGLPFWRSMEDAHAGKCAKLRLGWVVTAVPQYIPTLDFLARNGLELHSADHDIRNDLFKGELDDSLIALQDKGLLSKQIQLACFTLNEGRAPYYFPGSRH